MLLFSQLPEDHLESKVLTSVYSNEYDGYYVNLTDVSIVDLHSELNELISTSHTKIYYVDNWDHIAEFHKSPYDEGNITLFYTQRSHDSNDSRWYDDGLNRDDIHEAMQDAVAWGLDEAAYQSTATTSEPEPRAQMPPPSNERALPPNSNQGDSGEWIEQYDQQGNMYYFNPETQESKWEL
jgi:hypothetical protein